MTESFVRNLADRVQGPVFEKDDEGYAAELGGFQTAFRNAPDVVVGAAGPGDVRAAVEYAAARGWPAGAEATGHGRARHEPGGVLISTRRMASVRVDAGAGTAWIEAGARWRKVVEEAARYGLAPLNGSAPDVGAVGYTLGGGLPILVRTYGSTADHVRSIDVVTADGRQRHVTADSDPGLFWALRGAGANFGVVTSLEVGLVPVARLYGGGMYFDAGLVPEVLAAYARWAPGAPEQLNTSVSVLQYPDAPAMPEPIRGRYVAHVRIAYTGDAAAGEQLVEPMRAVGPRLIDTVRDMPYADCGSIYSDPPMPHAYYGSNLLLSDLDATALTAAAQAAGPDAPVSCVLDVRQLGGQLSRPPAVPSAAGHRDAQYVFRVLSAVQGKDMAVVRSTHEGLYARLARWGLGRSLNFIYGEDSHSPQLREAFEAADRDRLAALKAAYDPQNVFRLNYNILPPEGGLS